MQRMTLIAVSTKARFRRVIPKSYSYRYEVGATAGPPDEPLVESGAAIIETRYRGRAASWRMSSSMMSDDTYLVNGSFVAPDADNPMTYPPGAVPAAGTATAPGTTPGAAPAGQPAPAAPPTAAGGKPRATPSDAPGEERVFAFGRTFVNAAHPRPDARIRPRT